MGPIAQSLALSLLLFALLSPQCVRSQLNTCNGARPDRFNCAAQQCLACDHVRATCTFDVDNTTGLSFINCSVDPSRCKIETCDPCQTCAATYQKPSGWDFFSQWQLFSHCFPIFTGTNASCATNEIHPQCNNIVERETVYLDVNDPNNLHTVFCKCFEENCTQSLQYQATILPPTTQASILPSTTQPVPDDREEFSYILLIAILIPLTIAIVMISVVLAVIFCLRQRFKSFHQTNSHRPGRNGFESKSNDQQWQLLGQIGHGRYGFVYKALYQDEVVAIKIFSHNSRNSWENESNLFAMESTMHKNIVEYVTSETRGSGIQLQFFMITRYYSLGSLNQFLRRNIVSWEQACVMIHSVVCGLAHLHSERYTNSSGILAEKYAVAHRDLKSANILVRNERGECVVADLGFAMILDPSADAKELANTGQVGTFRYMAPEALDARVHLQDVQCFKQIDVYALALVMWEVVLRCCVLTEDDVPAYQLPYEDVAGLRPSLEVMKDIVAVRKLRPSLPAIWGNHELLNTLQETIHECWDGDPEARLPAANVLHRLEDLSTTTLNFFEETPNTSNTHGSTHQHTPAPVSMYSDSVAAIEIIDGPTEHSQSSPPPYYSTLDPISDRHHDSYLIPYHTEQGHIPVPRLFQSEQGRRRRPYFQNSMPHIMQDDQERLRNVAGMDYELTPRCSRSLRNSRVEERQGFQLNEYNSLQTLSARNSLALCLAEETESSFGRLEDTPGFLSDTSSVSSLGNESLEGQQEEEIGDSGVNSALEVGHNEELTFEQRMTAEALLSNGSEHDSNLNSDSGIQNLHSESTRTSASECEELSDHDGVPQSSTDVLQMSSTDTLDNVECETNPVITSPIETWFSMENSGNSVVTVTSV